jgi:hypothetical protein
MIEQRRKRKKFFRTNSRPHEGPNDLLVSLLGPLAPLLVAEAYATIAEVKASGKTFYAPELIRGRGNYWSREDEAIN